VLLSSEGVGTEVVQVEVPPRLTREPPPAPSASSSPAPPDAATGEVRRADRPDRSPLALGVRLVAGLAFLGALGLALRRLWRADRD
jgi:hypothetical protein